MPETHVFTVAVTGEDVGTLVAAFHAGVCGLLLSIERPYTSYVHVGAVEQVTWSRQPALLHLDADAEQSAPSDEPKVR